MEILASSLSQLIENGNVSLVQVLLWALAGLFSITTLIGGLLVYVIKEYLNDNKQLHKEHEESFRIVNDLLARHDVKIDHLEEKVYTVKYKK